MKAAKSIKRRGKGKLSVRLQAVLNENNALKTECENLREFIHIAMGHPQPPQVVEQFGKISRWHQIKKPNTMKIYTKEFKRNFLARVDQIGLMACCRELNVPPNTYYRWKTESLNLKQSQIQNHKSRTNLE